MGYASLVKPRYTQLPNHVSTSKRGDVIVRTGTGPVGMCLNTLTSVLGGYSTVVTVHCSCPPKGIVPLHCRSEPSVPLSGAGNMLDRLRGLLALEKLPHWVMLRRILGLSL